MKKSFWIVLLGLYLSACIPAPLAGKQSTATFAGGCFWCMESPFEKLDGVSKVISGYTGGRSKNPTYHDVSAGRTGHAEAVQITFDASRISYEELLDVFWRQINPTDAGGQFVDRGTQYRSEIYFHDASQEALAKSSRARLDASGRYDAPIVTPITAASAFYDAEEYHQDFYKKSPERYQRYRTGSGRSRYLKTIWEKELPKQSALPSTYKNFSKPSDAELRGQLTPLQYRVTQEDGTERPFDNLYWDNKAEGIYVDVVSGEPLFSSRDKFRSGTGWPSFFRALDPEAIATHADHKLLYTRQELRSKRADSHLGHLFPDGPEPTGLRYCINSASLRFVPKENLELEGLGEFVKSFKSGEAHPE